MRLHVTLPVLFMVLSACGTPPPAAGGRYATLKIYHTNDIHAHFSPDSRGRGGLAYLASVLRTVRRQEKDAVVLDAGDFYKKGSLPAQMSGDEATSDIMSQWPFYDARAVGNNEVKVGISKLLRWAKTKEPAPLLSANFVDRDGRPVFLPSLIIKKAGLNIGIIGVTAFVPLDAGVQPAKGDPRAPYKILKPGPLVADLIKKLRPQVDVLILLSHQPFVENVKWARQYPQVDLIVSGHSHVLTPEQKVMGGNMVVEAGEFGHQLGVVTLVYDRQTRKVASIRSRFWPIGPEMQVADPKIKTAVEAAYKKWAPDAQDKLAKIDGDMTVINAKNPVEGSLDDWVADAFCETARGDVGLVNRDMLREFIASGTATKEDLYLASPYEDEVAAVKIPRDKFIRMIEGSAVRDFNVHHLFGYAFSRARATLEIADGDPPVMKKVRLTLEASGSPLTVALPLYMVTHCREFFTAGECPLAGAKSLGPVRKILEERMLSLKRVVPPATDRIRAE